MFEDGPFLTFIIRCVKNLANVGGTLMFCLVLACLTLILTYNSNEQQQDDYNKITRAFADIAFRNGHASVKRLVSACIREEFWSSGTWLTRATTGFTASLPTCALARGTSPLRPTR